MPPSILIRPAVADEATLLSELDALFVEPEYIGGYFGMITGKRRLRIYRPQPGAGR